MFCKECGEKIESGGVCPKCGAPTGEGAGKQGQSGAQTFSENTAGILCYLLGWITGIVFLIIDKRPFVRFHAVQSILTFGALSALTVVLSRISLIFTFAIWSFFGVVNTLIGIGSIVLAVFLMLQAHQGKRYGLPFVGPIAEKQAEKQS